MEADQAIRAAKARAPSGAHGWELPFVLLLTAIGAALRFYGLGSRSTWFDDANLYWFVDETWGDLREKCKSFHSAPPLFVGLLKPLLNWNDSEFGLRFLPASIVAVLRPCPSTQAFSTRRMVR